MKSFLTIFRREFAAYFNSAIAVIFLIVFLLATNGLFMVSFFQFGKADMRAFFLSLAYILNVFIPAISMRLWTEDKRGNTYELLLTFPMKPWQLVLGKYLASLVFYAFALATTLTVPLMISWIGAPDPGPIVGGYLGSLFLGALFLAVGIFISGLCKDQIVAFILTVVAAFMLFFSGTDFFAAFIDGWAPGAGTFLRDHVGIASHMNGFAKGVIDLRDIFYFILGIFLFLFLNGLSLEGRYRPKAKLVFTGAVVACLASLVLANVLLKDARLGRFDITEGRSHTVSETSMKILRGLKAPVQLKLYISPADAMPTSLKTLERELLDKFDELREAAGGKLGYKVIHLDNAQIEEGGGLQKTLRDQGIVPFQVESIQRDEVGVKLIYSTLLIEYKEKPSEIVPRVMPQTVPDLEYQLLSRITKMTLEAKPRIAVYAPVQEEELPADLAKALGQDKKDVRDDFKTAVLLMKNNGYDTRRIAFTKEDGIPADTRMLMLFRPQGLTERQRYEVNRFLYQGGTVFIADQGFEYTFTREDKGVEAEPQKLDLSVNKLIGKWGLKIDDKILFDENSQVIALVTGQTVGPFAMQMPVKFPNQIIVAESTINRDAPLTSRIPSVAYLWGSALEISESLLKQIGLKHTVLFTSSVKSWKVANDGTTRLTAANTKEIEQEGRFPLAVLVEGQFSDAFDGAVPAWDAKDGSAALSPDAGKTKLEGAKPGRLLLVGCSKAFSEELIQNPGNLNFFANTVDGLTIGDDLVRIRSKAQVSRDIRRLTNEEKFRFKLFTVLLIPGLLLAAAIAKAVLRAKEKELYITMMKAQTRR